MTSLALGLSPILWGLAIDGIGQSKIRWLGLEWNRYSLFFTAVSGVLVVTLVLARRLEEPQAVSMEVSA